MAQTSARGWVDVGTFEGLLAWVVLDAGSQFIGEPAILEGWTQTGRVGRVVTCGTSLTGDAIARTPASVAGFAFSQPNSSVQVVK
jgi:hypothetical protein